MSPMVNKLRPGARSLAAIALFLCGNVAIAQAAPDPLSADGPMQAPAEVSRPHPVTNADIVRMSQAGLEEAILLQTIKDQPGSYDVTPDALIALKTSGVPQNVIAAMQAHGTGLHLRSHPANEPAPSRPVAEPSPLPLASGIDEIGVYYKSKAGNWIELKTERVELKSGGAAKSLLTHNIIKEDLNGHVDDAKSPLVLPPGVEILIYAPVGTAAEEYTFIRFREHKDNREFRVKTGGVFHSETGTDRDEIEFHAKKIGPQMYTFTVPADIELGQYGVLPPGSSNQRGLTDNGKIFTFSLAQ